MNRIRFIALILAACSYGAYLSIAHAQSGILGEKCTIDQSIDGGTAVENSGSPLQIISAISPNRAYSNSPSKPFNALVFHDPGSNNCDPMNMIRYGNRRDPSRGNAAYGYHFYISKDGKVYQAADLNRRTNHVGRNTRGTASGYSNATALGVTLMCGHQQIPHVQLQSAVRLGHSLQLKYQIPSNRVWGHGELQTNRSKNEGLVAARATRNSSASSSTQIQHSLPDGTPAICQIDGQPPTPCSGTSCETFSQTQDIRPVFGPQPPNQPIPFGQNNGYSLPSGGESGGGSSGNPTTDSKEWGYPSTPMNQTPFGQPHFPNSFNPNSDQFGTDNQEEGCDLGTNTRRKVTGSVSRGNARAIIAIKPAEVECGAPVKIGWKGTNVETCTMSGPEARSKKTQGLISLYARKGGIYTLKCISADGDKITAEAMLDISQE